MNTSMRRLSLLGLLMVSLFLASCDFGKKEAAEQVDLGPKPSRIIILDLDTLRATHLGTYGYERDTSPRIDAWAEEAFVFEYAFSQAPNTPPSQASILTSLYPSTHGMVFDEDRLTEDVTTLAEVLRDEGYETAAFVDGGYMSERFGMNQGFNLYDNNKGGGVAKSGPKAIEWMREHADENFLLLLHTYDVHTPYAPSDEFNIFLDGLEPPTPGFEPSSEQMEAVRKSIWTDSPYNLESNDLEWAKAHYDGEIRYLDDWVGGFLDEVAALGLEDDTVVVIISDHGEEFQEHGSVLHEKLYASVTHVPLIIRLPGQEEGTRIPQVVEALDLMPTLLDLIDVQIPPQVQGESLVPLMNGTSRPPWTSFGESPFFGHRRFVALDDYRMLWTVQGDVTELYNFREDPNEQNDLSEEMPDLRRRMLRALKNWQKMIDEAESFTAESGPLDEETLQQLRDLGYIQ